MRLLIVIVLSIIVNQLNAQTANWSTVSSTNFPTNVSGQIHGISRVSQMKWHSSSSLKRYAVSARGGLFITTNGGNSWNIAPGCDVMPYCRYSSVCVDHTNDQVIYLGTGDQDYYYNGLGVWKSTNGGLTFSQTGLTNKLVVDMIMDPTNNNIIVAITNTGIYRTINAGTSWTLQTASRPFDALLQKAPSSRVLYACTSDSAFFRSSDFGITWNQITSGIVLPTGFTNGNGCRIAVTPADTNVVYLSMVVNGGTLYKSTNGGTSFTGVKTTASPYLTYYDNSSSSSGQGNYNFGLGVDRTNANIVYMVAHNNWKSTDGGLTWTQLTNWWEKCHTDMHQIETSPYNNNELYNMNDGGIFMSTDGGLNWTPKSDGIYGYEIYHGNCSPTRKDMISIGTQDNGELYSTTSGWFTNRGGDWGTQCAFDYRPNSSMVYYYENSRRRLVNGSQAAYGLPSRVVNIDDITFHRGNTNLAFVADSFIYRTTNLLNTTPTWTQIASLGKIIKAIHVSYANQNVLYAITNDAKIHVSQDALSATPTFTTYNLPTSSNNAASITTVGNSAGIVYITINNRVYRSADFGATWTNITYNLPSVNHVRILADEYFPSNELMLVASSNAVYYKVASANTWTLYNTNLPSRPTIEDMSIFNDGTSNTILRVATYGRGMWETPISNLRTLNAMFSADKTSPCIGENVTFSNTSTGNYTSSTWSFPGGTPSSSTAASPVVVYNTPGVYSVMLTISDGTNSSTSTQTNYISTNGASLPYSENFEGAVDPPNGWQNLNLGSADLLWTKVSTASGFGVGTNSMMIDNYSYNLSGQKDELITNKMNLAGISSAKLFFDVAYQVFTGYSDSLAVFVSTDCGATYQKIYQKGGTVLSSAGSGGNNFVPTGSQWRTDTVSLAPYIGQQVLFKFQNINGYGNKLYLDNINVQVAPTASFTFSSSPICTGNTVSFTSTSTNNPTSYSWSFPGGSPSSSTLANPIVTYNTAGTYSASLTAINSIGSNTLAQSNIITVNPNTSNSTTVSACSTYTWSVNNQTYTSSGSYTVNTLNANQCNHSEILNLTITNPTYNTPQVVSACDSYVWNGTTYTQSGNYTSSLNPTTCSYDRLILTITPTTYNTSIQTACGSYTWNGTTYTQSGMYTVAGTSACSFNVLNLTITNPTYNTPQVVSACDSYVWNGTTYTQSGNYTSSLNPTTCSYDRLNLTITPTTYNTSTQTACGSYTWNGTTYTQSGMYTVAGTSACSFDVLDLTINSATQATISDIHVCSGSTVNLHNYVSPAGGTFNLIPANSYIPANGISPFTYTYFDVNAGCNVQATGNIIASPLQAVTSLNVLASSSNTANLSWSPVAGVAWYTLRYRELGSNQWIYNSVSGSSNSATIVGLSASTDYECEIRANCNALNQGSYAGTTYFSTLVSCPMPTNVQLQAVAGSNGSKLKVTFTANSNTGWHLLRYRPTLSGMPWTIISPVFGSGTTLTNLNPNTSYDVQVQAKCTTFDISNWSIPVSGSTGALGSKGVESLDEVLNHQVVAYPNPTNGLLTVTVSAVADVSCSILLKDIQGRKLLQRNAYQLKDVSQEYGIDLSQLASGVYLLEVTVGDQKEIIRVNKD